METDLILCSDIHIRETHPSCRLDDFVGDTQWLVLEFLKQTQQKYNCPIFCAGDFFDHWKPSPWLLTNTIDCLPEDFHTVYGQHDLPYHNYNLRNQAGLTTLAESGVLKIFDSGNWGTLSDTDLNSLGVTVRDKRILVMHMFVWDGKNIPFPGCDYMTAEQVLDKYSDFDLIVTGDHHKSFTFEKEGRLLVNPGCFTVQDASYKNSQPKIYLWNAQTNSVEPIALPHNPEDITREHIDTKKEHEKKLEHLVNKVKEEWSEEYDEGTDDPKKILDQLFKKKKVREIVQQIILKSIEK
jgi:predicted phosphodiesterase